MTKFTFILFINSFLIFHVYGQHLNNSSFADAKSIADPNKIGNSNILFGKLMIFPSGELINGLELILSFKDSLKYYDVDYELDGKFSLQTNFNGVTDISIVFSDPNLRKKEPYYPVEIKNVRFNMDSVNLGLIPIIVDTFGYYEEWGVASKKNFYTKNIYNMENRLKMESKLNILYNGICNVCTPIFITETHKDESRKSISSWELRKFSIEYNELMLISNYFYVNSKKAR